MAGNGGIIGPTKVISTSQTKTTTFTSSGTFSKLNCSSTARVLVVAGGGAGGANQPAGNSSGGGGAGGFRTNCSLSLTPGPITVTVGAGGAGVAAGPPTDGDRGGQGSQSIIAGTSLGYSQYKYDFHGATRKRVIYPSLDPSIFEIKYPNTDIKGRVTTY